MKQLPKAKNLAVGKEALRLKKIIEVRTITTANSIILTVEARAAKRFTVIPTAKNLLNSLARKSRPSLYCGKVFPNP
jgi:hypothetical protein